METEPTLPIYAPELVADVILKCAHSPQRDILVGGGGKMMSVLGEYAPGLSDFLMLKGKIFGQQAKEELARQRPDALYEAGFGMEEHGEVDTPVIPVSPYTSWAKLPIAAKVGLAGVALFAFVGGKSKK